MTSRYPKVRLVRSDAAISVAVVRRAETGRNGGGALDDPVFEAAAIPPQRGGAIPVAFACTRREH
jgi:hypothetical protein